MARKDLSLQIASAVGNDVLGIVNLGEGWPTIYEVAMSSTAVQVAAHVTKASPHARRPYEWRIQNPADSPPITAPGGALPVMIGIDNSDAPPVLIAIDGRSRIGRERRFSILFNRRIIDEARSSGWSEYEAGNGQIVFALQPRLLPLLIEMFSAGAVVPQRSVAEAAAASGLLDDNDKASGERARRIASVYVRDAKFSKDVREAYEHKCAMCGVKLGLVAGAHIYPVSAPKSPDKVWNGLALCHNHHSAFDAFKLWVNKDFSVHVNPTYKKEASDADSKLFLTNTRTNLILPKIVSQHPKAEMFTGRYKYYLDQYDWAPKFG